MQTIHVPGATGCGVKPWLCFSRLAGVLCCLALLLAMRAHVSAQGKAADKKKGAAATTKKEEPKQESASAKVEVASWNVKGRGRTQEEAEKDALEQARAKVGTFLQRQDPPFLWKPALDFIKKHLLAANPRPLPDEDQEIVNQVEKVTMKCWEWPVKITAGVLQDMRQEDNRHRAELARLERHARAEERMVALAKFSGWAVLALVGVCLYLRLDQWTQGTHRGWLRLALWSLLASSGIGWWLLS
jgi:hypothetical protein